MSGKKSFKRLHVEDGGGVASTYYARDGYPVIVRHWPDLRIVSVVLPIIATPVQAHSYAPYSAAPLPAAQHTVGQWQYCPQSG